MEITPYKGVGAYRLGMTREACAEAVGPAERVNANLPMQLTEELRGPVQASFDKKGKLVMLIIKEPADVRWKGQSVFDDPNVVAALRAADPTHEERGAYIDCPKLGVCLGGMGRRRLREGREVLVYARSQRAMMQFLGAV